MAWVAAGVTAASAVGSGVGSYLSAKSANKRNPRGIQYQPYSGSRPPQIDYGNQQNLRPVQQQITDILMRRSQGQDVGYDPRLLTSAMSGFDATQAQQADRAKQDINNELSGTGQSRNLAARELSLGRQAQDQQRQKTEFTSNLDVANLERANQEKQSATQGLQNLNTFDFGQENTGANFDLATYNAQNAAQVGDFGTQLQSAQNYQDPLANAVQGASAGVGIGQQYQANTANTGLTNAYSTYLQGLANAKKQNTTPQGQNLNA